MPICSTDETAVDTSFQPDDFGATGAAGLAAAIQMMQEEFRITDFGTVAAANRWRRSDGLTPNSGIITLGCFFLSGTRRQRESVQEWAQGWLRGGIEQLIRFDFNVTQERSHIRILLDADVNNSRIGRDALNVAKTSPTLRLSNVDRATCQHEFGHALGLLHEHQNPTIPVRLREQVIIDEMARWPNEWSPARTRQNIINKLGADAQCVSDPTFNPDSIMMYNLPGRWVEGGQGLRRANQIDDRDLTCVLGVYAS